MRYTCHSALVLSLLTLAASSVCASTIRSDVSDSLYTALAASDVYSGVGQIYETTSSGTYAGSGTLISSEWVLTAAHMVTDASSSSSLTYVINGVTYYADSYTYYSGYSSTTLSGDLALVHLTTAVTGVTYATLYSGTTSSLIGLTATYVGYGVTGTGSAGYTEGTYGTKRAVQNVLDTVGSSVYSNWPSTDLIADFDSPATNSRDRSGLGSSTPLALEGLIAPGDSGGGAFVTIGDTTYLVGVISFLGYSDGTSNADYGDYAGIVSVTEYLDWIYDVTGISASATIPEPSTAGMTLCVLGAVLLKRRRTANH